MVGTGGVAGLHGPVRRGHSVEAHGEVEALLQRSRDPGREGPLAGIAARSSLRNQSWEGPGGGRCAHRHRRRFLIIWPPRCRAVASCEGRSPSPPRGNSKARGRERESLDLAVPAGYPGPSVWRVRNGPTEESPEAPAAQRAAPGTARRSAHLSGSNSGRNTWT